MTEVPGTGTLAVTDTEVSFRFLQNRGSGQSLKRNQKAYMAFYDTGGIVRVNQNGSVKACTAHATTATCVSAPLFIASQFAVLCTDGDIGDATADSTNNIQISICADSTCADVTSITTGSPLLETSSSGCAAGGVASVTGLSQISIAGQWIYVELIVAPDAGDEVLVWVTGQ
jgi:hypothetical protein